MADEHDFRGRRTPDETTPIDVAAVRADDAFIDALSRDVPVLARDDAEYQLAAALSGWRYESLAAPAPPLPAVEEIEKAIAAQQRVDGRGRRAMRHLRVLSGAAAVVVVAAAGLIVVSENAQPGDALWGVKSVVFSEQATQTQAMVDVQSNLEQAEAAVAAGDTPAALSYISKAEEDLKPVRDEETRRRMDEWITRLRDDTDESAVTKTATGEESASADRQAASDTTDTTDTSTSATTDSTSTTTTPVETTPVPSDTTPPSEVPPSTTAAETTIVPTTTTTFPPG